MSHVGDTNGSNGRRVTLDDVAARAKVHKATVSRALNPATENQVGAETLRRVRKAARELSYVPNVVARGLRTRLSMTVGVIIPDLTNPIFPPIMRGIENYLLPRHYTALLANTDGHEAVEQSAFESLLRRQVDGFILATGRLDVPSVAERARREGIFTVMVNREAAPGQHPAVMPNNEMGIAAAVHHLVELGHRRIVHLSGPAAFSTSRRRAEAFRASTDAIGSLDASIVPASALTIEAGEHAMDALLSDARPRPTAVIAGNDLVALGALRSMRTHRLQCPDDISVVGFNDMPFAEDFSPALTTVRIPLHDLGSEAARLLLNAIQEGKQEPVTLTLPSSLIVRSSTGPAPQ